jgi:membrane associated rhomboid family serine protease
VAPPRASAASALGTILLFVAVLWAVEVVDTVLGGRLDHYGVRPRTDDGLLGVAVAPLLHGGFGHLLANTAPLLVLGFLLLLHGLRRWAQVTAVVWVVGGLGTWLTGSPGSIHIGASGLVFGWLAYLILIGFLNGRLGQIAVGVLVLVLYGGLLWGVLPGAAGVSWQGHLFGAVGGVVAALWLQDAPAPRRTPAPPAWRG